MPGDWADFFYGHTWLLDLSLSSSNWVEWNAKVVHLLQPFEKAAHVLRGQSTSERPWSLSVSTIDTELFFFLFEGLQKDVQGIAMDVRARYGPSGSKLYRILKAHFDEEIQEPYTSQPLIETTSRCNVSITSLLHRVSSGRTGEHESNGGVSNEGAEPRVPSSTVPGDGSKKRKKVDDIYRLQKDYIGLMMCGYTLPAKPWPCWSAKLRMTVHFYNGAEDILTGAIGDDNPEYEEEIDELLFSIVQGWTSWDHYQHIITATYNEHGKKGSKLYAALKREVEKEKRSEFDMKVRAIAENGVNIVDCYSRLSRLHQDLKDYDISLAETVVAECVESVVRKYSRAQKSQLLAKTGHATLHIYYADLMKQMY